MKNRVLQAHLSQPPRALIALALVAGVFAGHQALASELGVVTDSNTRCRIELAHEGQLNLNWELDAAEEQPSLTIHIQQLQPNGRFGTVHTEEVHASGRGEFSIDNLPPGEYRIVTSGQGSWRIAISD